MTKQEKQYYINKEYTAYYSGFSGLEIKEIQYGIEDYIIFVAGAWCSKKSVHRSRIRYTAAGRAYFMYNGSRIPLDECIRKGF